MNRPVLPLLLLDVDDVLNPWTQVTKNGHRAAAHYTRYDLRPVGYTGNKDPLAVLLSSEHATALQDLRTKFTLVWATTWMEEANEFLSPLLGLPTDIPAITWPQHALDTYPTEGRNGSWKTPFVARWLDDYARGLPWVWVDDEVNRYDRFWFTSWYMNQDAPPHKLLRINPKRGMVKSDFEALHEFADSLTT